MTLVGAARQSVKRALRGIAHWRIERVRPQIVRTFPHDPQALTQGLAWIEGALYESTGGEQGSSVRRLNFRNGAVEIQRDVAHDWGEGIARVDDSLLQLSWKSGEARVFELPDLQPRPSLRYEGEGWGLAACPGGLVLSDGSSALRFTDAQLRTRRRLPVRANGWPVRRLNDLEFVGGVIYANVWFAEQILAIDAGDGRVRRIIDCSALCRQAGATEPDHVLNGIAFAPERGTFFLCGKRWPMMFEAQIAGVGADG